MNPRRISIPGADLSVRVCGDGPPVLLVHGFPLDHTMWNGQLDALTGVQLIAPDLRGFGRSHGTIGDRLTMAELSDDLAALLETLAVPEPITICGLSMGGYVAFEFWNRHPEMLSRLILCDTRAAADTAETAKGRQLAAHQVLADGNAAMSASMVPKLVAERTTAEQPALVRRLRRLVNEAPPATVAAALRGMAVRSDFTAHLVEIEVPALLLCGSDDVITPAREMQAMAKALPSAQYVEVPHAGHMAPLEQPAVVNEAIAAFMRDAPKTG